MLRRPPSTTLTGTLFPDTPVVRSGCLLALDDWQSKTAGMVSCAGGGDRLFPLGQGIGLAATFRKRYGNVAKLVQAIRRASRQQIDQAASLRFIDGNGALAASHGTRFPLAQGPMTRVSDSPDFVVEVARGGARSEEPKSELQTLMRTS